MDIIIHHNPDCGTSRNVIRIITAVGITARQALWTSKIPAEGLRLLHDWPAPPFAKEDGNLVLDANGNRVESA